MCPFTYRTVRTMYGRPGSFQRRIPWSLRGATAAVLGYVLCWFGAFAPIHELGHLVATFLVLRNGGIISWNLMWTTSNTTFVTAAGAGGMIVFTFVVTVIRVRYDRASLFAAPGAAIAEYIFFFGSADYYWILSHGKPLLWVFLFVFVAPALVFSQLAMLVAVHLWSVKHGHPPVTSEGKRFRLRPHNHVWVRSTQ